MFLFLLLMSQNKCQTLIGKGVGYLKNLKLFSFVNFCTSAMYQKEIFNQTFHAGEDRPGWMMTCRLNLKLSIFHKDEVQIISVKMAVSILKRGERFSMLHVLALL